ncbi:hypothetical protein PB1_12944 [Bacillus methanolicus PB1]|uniref:Uncharacterized protein n=1 Tax=Bacillus methanolicus PB1 TaxID=997296 RepID=I3DW44_BACMT|nr:hypothetical protein [Bacillus methanolicus]EIJ78465.1 hypothetical protein PB1_12944 [Bacillus methanolicus PB1]
MYFVWSDGGSRAPHCTDNSNAMYNDVKVDIMYYASLHNYKLKGKKETKYKILTINYGRNLQINT